MNRPLPAEPFTLIHVGKCAGSSVSAELRAAGHAFQVIHVRKPPVEAGMIYVIVVRDPAERFVSAFQWRKYILSQQPELPHDCSMATMKHRFEQALLAQFPDANALAEAIDPHDPTAGLHGAASLVQLIGHVPLGFAWYLDALLDRIQPNQLLAALAVESLPSDMEQVFGIRLQSTEKMHYPGKSGRLSSRGRQNLEQLFDGEYRTLRRLALLLEEGGGYRPPTLQTLAQNLS